MPSQVYVFLVTEVMGGEVHILKVFDSEKEAQQAFGEFCKETFGEFDEGLYVDEYWDRSSDYVLMVTEQDVH